MNPTKALPAILLVLFFTFISNPSPFSNAAEAPSPVLDINNKPVRAGTRYYILPITRGPTYGLKLAATANKTCPLHVIQDYPNVSNGIPAILTPVNPKKGVIRLSTDLNIKFSVDTACPESTVWRLAGYDPKTGQRFVTTGGVEGNPGRATLSNWFKIEKQGFVYKLVFCPTVCKVCKPVCGDVGTYEDEDGKRRLALGGVPLAVVFLKA